MSLEPEKLEERKKKIIIISEIDELKVIANNHYLMCKYDDAIKTAKEIIDLAKKVELNSIVREQEKFITKIYQIIEQEDQKSFIVDDFEDLKIKFAKLSKNERIDEAHEEVEKFKQKYGKIIDLSPNLSIEELLEKEQKVWNKYSTEQNNIKRQLEPLEIQLESYLSTNNLILARETLHKAKPILKNLKDTALIERWGTMEAMFTELKTTYDFREEVENSMKEITKLTDEYKFDGAKKLLKAIKQVIEEKSFTDYKKEIKIKERSMLDAEQKYNKLIKDIESLENLVERNIANFLFEDAVINCKQIIKISRFIGKLNYVDKYSKYIADIEAKLQKYDNFENFRENLISMNKEALDALNKGDFSLALNKFKQIRIKLIKFAKTK
ncbi:MAG: hypothetical protein ACXACC_03605 [Promethearchaeota archaeon]|jgi:hypothetical protein